MKTYPVLPTTRAGRVAPAPAAPAPAARTPWWMMGLGVSLLGLSFILAASALHSPSQAQSPSSSNGSNGAQARLDRRAVAVAYVDVEGGVMNLSPGTAGRVVGLPVAEGVPVKKGTLLLQIDDALAKVRVREAQVDLDASKEKLVQAKKLVGQHRQKLTMQEAAVQAAKKKMAAAEAQASKIRRLNKAGVGGSSEDVQTAESLVAEAEAGVKVAEEQLALFRTMDPNSAIQLAELDVQAKTEQLKKAQIGLRECRVEAPENGKILRTLVNHGEVFAPSPVSPALQFYPDKPLIVRAEVEQEFGGKVTLNQKATIEDELVSNGPQWTGKVTHISDWYGPRRVKIQEPGQFNDVRTMEVIIHLDPIKKGTLRINQRVRVKLDGQE